MVEDDRTRGLRGDQLDPWNFEHQGTLLSLLFREVVDKTILARTRAPAKDKWESFSCTS
jgi:hypothetical protein